ncbi:phosphoglycerate mutase-like protein 4 [Durio zibethinus]|uniref:Phosphoglycerate mutase-like protein 4 n=1 Tax=Durio zibethinus TaxID=66656 RepID=A0A6P6BAL9_DURZI|nr:phosphoglycerate mutase-like protein 4 [Durio zibethinus]
MEDAFLVACYAFLKLGWPPTESRWSFSLKMSFHPRLLNKNKKFKQGQFWGTFSFAMRHNLSVGATSQSMGGGESLDQLYHHSRSSLQIIGQKQTGELVVVVIHGGVIRALYRQACSNRFRGSIINTSVNIFHLSGADVWTIKAWGDISNLHQT